MHEPVSDAIVFVLGAFFGASVMGIIWIEWLLGRIQDRLKHMQEILKG